MKKIILSLFLIVMLFSCANMEKPQAVRQDRLFEEFDFHFFELKENERIATVNINLRPGQTTIFWRSNLQRDFVVTVNEECELDRCGKENCIVTSTETGHVIGFVFLLPEEVDEAERIFSELLFWEQEENICPGLKTLLYEEY